MEIEEIAISIGENSIDIVDKYKIPGLVEKTGISVVYETNETTVGLAAKAINSLPNLNKADIKAMFMVTQSPDDYLPANAISLSNKVEMPKSLLTMDFNQGCSGFVQAFALCEDLLKKYNKILLVTCDRYRAKCKPSDRSTNAVFSDGASAMVLQQNKNMKVHYENHMTAGEYRDLLFQSTSEENDGHIHMAGADIWLFTRREVVPQINDAINYCKENNLIIKGVYIHQASKLVVDGIKQYVDIDEDLFYENYSKFGNTVSSSIPLLINDFPFDLKASEVVILAGFGVGLTSSVLVYGDTK